MQYATKRFLLSSDQIKSLTRKNSHESSHKISHPYKKATKVSKDKLKTTLINPALGEWEKLLQYTQDFNKYLKNLKSAITTSKKQAILGKLNTSPDAVLEHPSPPPTPLAPPPPPPPALPIPQDQPAPAPSSSITTTPVRPRSTPSAATLAATANLEKNLSAPKTSDPYTRRREAQIYQPRKLINYFDEEERPQVQSILSTLEGHRAIDWNRNTGVFSLNGKTLRDSNVLAYVQDRLAKKATFQPRGRTNAVNRALTEAG